MAKSLNGVRVDHYKNTEELKAEAMPTPKSVRILLTQHIGVPCTPTVKVGDMVKAGQVIGESDQAMSATVHASISGKVSAIDKTVYPDGKKVETVVVDWDGERLDNTQFTPPTITDYKSFIKAVKDSGMVGLGGAAFPTHVKFSPKNLQEVNTLIVNAAECEPYITSDYRTMMDNDDDLFHGIEMAMKYMDINRCIICVEDNTPLAIEKLAKKVKDYKGIEVLNLPSIYPQGSEKVMIYHAMDGLTVPEGKFPADVGVLVSNVTTMAKLGDYFKTGKPLIDKCITVDGGAVKNPKNVIVPIGTSVKEVMEFCGGYKEDPSKIILGGPMMGITVEADYFPVLKSTNALIAFTKKESTYFVEEPCIRCGECMRVCPIDLMPFNMKMATERKDVEKLISLKANLCIECGCCSYVCPAMQELVTSHKEAKNLIMQYKNK